MIIEFLVPYERPAANLVLVSPDFGLNNLKNDLIGLPLKVGDIEIGIINDILDVSYYYDDYQYARVRALVTAEDKEPFLCVEDLGAEIDFENQSAKWIEKGNIIECSRCHNKVKHSVMDTYPKYCPWCGKKVYIGE